MQPAYPVPWLPCPKEGETTYAQIKVTEEDRGSKVKGNLVGSGEEGVLSCQNGLFNIKELVPLYGLAEAKTILLLRFN